MQSQGHGRLSKSVNGSSIFPNDKLFDGEIRGFDVKAQRYYVVLQDTPPSIA